MDGTLVDTEPYWMHAQDELMAAWGGTWTHEDALGLVGAGLWNAARVFQSRGVHLTEDEIVDHLTERVLEQIASNGLPWRPGARELLSELREAGVPTALVTMSVRRMAEHVAAQLGFHGFDTVVSGDDVTQAKPHPEPYLVAAERLGVDPASCIAIEDSGPGTASAVAAGAVVIAVPFVVPLPESPEYTRWESLDGHTLAELSALVAPVAS
jgi:HAD superfamily hydrolase (TIGR01509 family)